MVRTRTRARVWVRVGVMVGVHHLLQRRPRIKVGFGHFAGWAVSFGSRALMTSRGQC